MTHKLRYRQGEERLVALIGDEDTVTGFLLAGTGANDPRKSKGSNFLVVNKSTPLADIEGALKKFLERGDIGIVIICQHVANDVRHILSEHKSPIPIVMEIPSKDTPYDGEKDEVLTKINRSLGLK